MKKTILFIFGLLFSYYLAFAIDAPSNTSPSNGATNQGVEVTIDWSSVSGNSGYIYQLDIVDTFDSPLLIDGTSGTSNSNATIYNLYFGQTYYWQAAAKSSVDTSNWSAVWNFTTKDIITLVSPLNAETNQNVYLELDWYTLSGVNKYDVECDTSSNFNSSLYRLDSTTSSNFYQTNLNYGTTYYWRVRGRHSTDTTSWSETRSFSTKDYVTLVTPADGLTNQNVYLQLDWYEITGSNSYQVELDTISSFDSPENRLDEAFYSYLYESALRYGTEYFWRVRACHVNDTSEWSVVRSFSTKDYVTLVSPTDGLTNQNVYLQLDWYDLTGSNSYQVELDTISSFDSPENRLDEAFYSYLYESALRYGTEYFWRVRACHVNDTSEWSAIWHFSTKGTITQIAPSNGAIEQTVYPRLGWAALSGSSEYEWEIDTTSDFNSDLLQNGITGNTYEYISNLYYNTEYFWRVRGHNTSDTSEWSTIWSFTTQSTISNISPANGATNVSVNPTLYYSASSGSTGYLCELDTSMSFNSDIYQLANSATTNVTATSLLYGTTYYWHAATRNAVDTSNFSAIWSFTTAYELTEAPILISPVDESINIPYPTASVSWNASTGAVTYQFQYSEDPTFATGIHSYTTSMISGSLTGLYPHTAYYWRVRGANANGYSPWSTVWHFTTESADLVPPVLVSPANDAVDIDTDNVVLDWNSVFGASGYIFEITEDENFISGITTQMVSETYKNIIGLAYGTQYFWRVKSTDGVVESDWSAVWNFTTEFYALEIPAPISPANSSTGVDFATVILDWNSVAGASQYIYIISSDMNFDTYLEMETVVPTEATITDLEPNTQYFWKVKASNGVIESDWTAIWNFTTTSNTLDTPILVAPTDNSIALDYNSVTIDWDNVISATSYTYEYSTDETFSSNVVSNITTQTEFEITGLEPITEYFWRVKAFNSTLESDWSETWSFKTIIDNLDTPVLVSPANNSINLNFTLVTLDWEMVSNASNYTYELSLDEDFENIVQSEIVSNTYIDILNLNPETQYFWHVKSHYETIESDWSEVWNFTTDISIEIIENLQSELEIYPNPNNGIFKIEGNNIQKVRIINVAGKLVYENSISQLQYDIDISKLKSGIYFIEAIILDKKIDKKIVVYN